MKQKSIIYFYTSRSSFVREDIDILSGPFRVIEYAFNPPDKKLTPVYLVLQWLFILKNIFSADIFLCMFGGYHSFFPSLAAAVFRKKCYIIAGGTDCVSFPSIGYGNFRKGLLSIFTKYSYRLCSMILPVHRNLMGYEYTYSSSDFDHQGIRYFMPGIKTPFREINYGFDPSKWVAPANRIKNSFITVAAGLENPYRAKLKGIDLILDIAPLFPEAQFTIIGCPENYNLPTHATNIKTNSFVSQEKLKELYNTHEFYIQVSLSEGFPNSICEAMLCGCIPIGSAVGGIEDIIGDAGFILRTKDKSLFAEMIREALKSDKQSFSAKASGRIKSNYPPSLRKEKLFELLTKFPGT